MRRAHVAGLAAALSVTLLVGTAASASAGTLDQQQPAIGSTGFIISSSHSDAQTFTAGISGGLDQADLALRTIVAPAQDLIVEIRDASAAGPGGQVLATQRVPPSSVPVSAAFVPVVFSPPAPVVAGQQYAIVTWSFAADPPGDYSWQQADGLGDAYPPGAMFVNTTSHPPSAQGWSPVGPSDFGFKTYVVPTPTPASTPPTGITGQRASALASCKKRARHHHWTHKRLKRCRKEANLLPI